MPGTFTAAQFHRWNAAIDKTSPGAASPEDIAQATLATGLVVQGVRDGILLRLTDETGKPQTFRLNAAIAMRMHDTIPLAAIMAGWLNTDGSISALPDRQR